MTVPPPSADATAGERERVNAIDDLIEDFQRACEACGAPVTTTDNALYKHRAILRNALRAKLLAASSTPASDARSERRIYIASRTRHAARWKALRDQGCPIVSSWIDEAGPGETADWQDLWDRCIAEASQASALIVYAEDDDKYLKGALVEVGAALSHGVPVYLAMGDRNVAGSAWNHRLVTDCESFDDALALALANRAASTPDRSEREGAPIPPKEDR